MLKLANHVIRIVNRSQVQFLKKTVATATKRTFVGGFSPRRSLFASSSLILLNHGGGTGNNANLFLNKKTLLPLQRHRHPHQVRSIIHLPGILGLAGVKIFSLLLVKKALVYAVLRKYGIKKTFELFRAANLQLRTTLAHKQVYSEESYLKVNSSLNTIEELLLKAESLSLDEQAEVIVKKLSAMPELTTDLQQKVYQMLKNYSALEERKIEKK